MNIRELINKTLFRNNKYQIIKNNLTEQYFPDNKLQFGFDHILYSKLMSTDNFFFIQVGANDGKRNDPIHHYVKNELMTGILLEPVKYYFNKLSENYADLKKIVLLNMALHPSETEVIIYKIDENAVGKDGVPIWAGGISTFSKEIMDKHGRDIPGYEKYLVQETVPCISWKELLKDNKVNRIDLLLIDTEGFDYEIIKMVDFSDIKPAIIRFEHKHLQRSDLIECMRLLVDNKYLLFYEENDLTAYCET